jgi:asparagine synthase (glutamine-hydrolysing)
MCGIAGIFHTDQTRPAERDTIVAMATAMAHRGPEAEGFFVRDHVALGHRRLRIIDLEGGKQPLFNEDHSVVVVYNGEIFNFREVQAELEAKGHRFRTHCDTEVIVHAYEEYGDECPAKFRGMFAFAIFDARANRLFLCRDRLGIKPLYYTFDQGTLLFASEVNALLKAMPQRPGIDRGLLDFYVSLGYVPGAQTLFEGIHKLQPGHTLTLEHGRIHIVQYWDLEDTAPLDLTFEQAKERFEALLNESIRMRLMSDVPLGAFLSGGLDSSSVVACMSRMTADPVKTFSVGYSDDPDSSELGYARIVADHFKTDHHEFVLEPGDFFQSLDLLLTHTEEPVVESAAVALYHLSKLAKEHVTVILSGEGGDEILAGYPLYQIMPKVDRLHSVLRHVPRSLVRMVARQLGKEKYVKYADWASSPIEHRYWGISSDVTPWIKSDMYDEGLAEGRGDRVRDYFERLFNMLPSSSRLRRMTYVDLKTWLPDDLLLKADKMTMAASLELRVPLLDHKLLEFATALPDSYRLNGSQGKYLLKKVMEPYLPQEIIYRKKRGFPVPVARWFRNELYSRTAEILLDSRTLSRRYFTRSYVEGVLNRHRAGHEDLSRRIFSLLALETWHRRYVD